LTEGASFKIDVLAAITNSNLKFIANLRTFSNRVGEETQAEESTIHQKLSYNKLIKEFALISNLSFKRIQESVIKDVEGQFLKVGNYKDMHINNFLEGVFLKLEKTFMMLMKSYRKKMWRFVFENFSTLYI
jgi:hypothetical protein